MKQTEVDEIADAAGLPLFIHMGHAKPMEALERFALEVERRTLERAAKVCQNEWSNTAERMYAEECAKAIRTLGEK